MRFLKSLFSINPATLTFGGILLVILLFLFEVPILNLIELKTYDLRFLSRGQVQPSPTVVLALIDEKSLDTEGRWPWPRSKMAALVDALSQDGARVIGLTSVSWSRMRTPNSRFSVNWIRPSRLWTSKTQNWPTSFWRVENMPTMI